MREERRRRDEESRDEESHESVSPADAYRTPGLRSAMPPPPSPTAAHIVVGARIKIGYPSKEKEDSVDWYGGTCLGPATTVLEAKADAPNVDRHVFAMDDGVAKTWLQRRLHVWRGFALLSIEMSGSAMREQRSTRSTNTCNDTVAKDLNHLSV